MFKFCLIKDYSNSVFLPTTYFFQIREMGTTTKEHNLDAANKDSLSKIGFAL